MSHRTTPIAVVALFALSLVSCGSPQGRIMEDTEQDHVGSKALGAAGTDRLVSDVVTKVLNSYSGAHAGVGKLKVAVLRVDNASSEELGDFQEYIFDLISTSINRSGRFQTISLRFVNEALRESRKRREQLFLPKHRREFLAVLERQNNPAQILIFPKLSSGTTRSDDVRQRNYQMTLVLVDVESGEDHRESTVIRKAYTR